MARLTDLSTELLCLIAKFVAVVPIFEGQSAIKSLSLTCTLLRDPAQRAMFSNCTVRIRNFDDAAEFLRHRRVFAFTKSTRKLNLAATFGLKLDPALNPDQAAGFGAAFAERVSMAPQQLDRQFVIFARVSRHFSQVKELELNLCITLASSMADYTCLHDLDKAMGDLVFARVTHVEIRVDDRPSSDVIMSILARTPNLSNLTVSGQGFFDRPKRAVSLSLPHLRRLDTSRLSDTSLDGLADCFSVTTLEHVDTAVLREVASLFDEYGYLILENLRNLTIDKQSVTFKDDDTDTVSEWESWLDDLNDSSDVSNLSLRQAGHTLTIDQLLRIVPESVEHVSFSADPTAVWNAATFVHLQDLVRGKRLRVIEVHYANTEQSDQTTSDRVRKEREAEQTLKKLNIELVLRETEGPRTSEGMQRE